MQPHILQAGAFHIFALLRAPSGASVLRVYIEGDGHAWLTRDTPSDDPTPWDPVALKLAARDDFPAAAYLGRPCQYVGTLDDVACRTSVWTDSRYSVLVVSSINDAIDELRRLTGVRTIELIGFSGGGPIAALVAARRTDVEDLRTVAGNLDTALWTALNHVSPLRGSLNPADIAPRLAGLPQVHFIGSADDVVQEPVVRAFQRRAGDSACVRVVVVPGAGHGEGWTALWPRLLGVEPGCRNRVSRTQNLP